MSSDEVRDEVPLTNLGQPLFDGADATKRDLVDYLDTISDRIIPELAERPLSVIRVLRGQDPFMQKNVPKYTPPWVRTVRMWAEASHREVSYALCNDRRTLLWFANQRAVEYHPALFRIGHENHPTHLVLDIDPPAADEFRLAVRAAHLIQQALADAGLAGAVKTSGAKGLHVFVPIEAHTGTEDVAAATRALAARATVAAVFSPRIRPGVPVSFPVAWDDLDRIAPADFTIRTARQLIGGANPWADQMPAPQRLSPDLIAEGHTIPVAGVQAMHEGKRRARARRGSEDEG